MLKPSLCQLIQCDNSHVSLKWAGVIKKHVQVIEFRLHVSLSIAPLLAGLVMSAIGSIRRGRGMPVIRLDSFAYGFIFAFGMALIRFLFTK